MVLSMLTKMIRIRYFKNEVKEIFDWYKEVIASNGEKL